MPEDLYSLLGIMSPEAEAVGQLLRPQTPPERQVYGRPEDQALADYHRNAEMAMAQRGDVREDATIQRFANVPTVMGAHARQAAFQKSLQNALYEKQAKALMDELTKLDPADPEALAMQDEIIGRHPIAREALSDPRISGLIKRQSHDNAEMQELFDKDPTSRQEYADLRTNNIPPQAARQQVRSNAQRRAERIWFATNGGDPMDFDSGKFNGPDGRPDRAKMAHFLSQRKSADDALLGSTERKALDEAADSLRAMVSQNPDDEATKRAAYQMARGKQPESEQEWAEAYRLVQNAGREEKEKLASLILDFERAGRQVPNIYKNLIVEPTEASVQNVPHGTSEQTQKPSTPQVPIIRTRAEYDALPSGTRYMDSKGNTGTKK